jgi:hypothetical protein
VQVKEVEGGLECSVAHASTRGPNCTPWFISWVPLFASFSRQFYIEKGKRERSNRNFTFLSFPLIQSTICCRVFNNSGGPQRNPSVPSIVLYLNSGRSVRF